MAISSRSSTLVKARLVNWAALIRVENLRLAEPRERFLQSRDAEVGFHMLKTLAKPARCG